MTCGRHIGISDNLSDQPERSWGFLLLAYVLVAIATAALVVISTSGPIGEWVAKAKETRGPGLFSNLARQVFFWVLVIFALKRGGVFSWNQLGLDRSRLGPAVRVTLLLWVMLQAVEIVAGLLSGEPLQLRLGLLGGDHGLAEFVVAVFAVAIGEEIFYRGFLQDQLVRKFHASLIGVAVASIAFGIVHVPIKIVQGQSLGWIVPITGIGLALGIVYQTTANLFTVIGLHALFNNPALVFKEQINHRAVLGVLALAYAVAFSVRHRQLSRPDRLEERIRGTQVQLSDE